MSLDNEMVLTEQRMSAGLHYSTPHIFLKMCFYSMVSTNSINYDVFYFLKPFALLTWIFGRCLTMTSIVEFKRFQFDIYTLSFQVKLQYVWISVSLFLLLHTMKYSIFANLIRHKRLDTAFDIGILLISWFYLAKLRAIVSNRVIRANPDIRVSQFVGYRLQICHLLDHFKLNFFQDIESLTEAIDSQAVRLLIPGTRSDYRMEMIQSSTMKVLFSSII